MQGHHRDAVDWSCNPVAKQDIPQEQFTALLT